MNTDEGKLIIVRFDPVPNVTADSVKPWAKKALAANAGIVSDDVNLAATLMRLTPCAAMDLHDYA